MPHSSDEIHPSWLKGFRVYRNCIGFRSGVLTEFWAGFCGVFFWILLKTGAFSVFLQACLKKLLQTRAFGCLLQPFLGLGASSGPFRVFLWAFCGLLGLFPAFSGPRGLFWGFWPLPSPFWASGPLLELLASSQPFLGLRASSVPFLRPRASFRPARTRSPGPLGVFWVSGPFLAQNKLTC